MTSLKGVSSMKLHRDLGIRQATAWFMLHRIREAFSSVRITFKGPVRRGRDRRWWQAGEHEHIEAEGAGKHEPRPGPEDGSGRRQGPGDGQGGGSRGRFGGQTLNVFVDGVAEDGAEVYTDGSTAYRGRKNHESVAHGAGGSTADTSGA